MTAILAATPWPNNAAMMRDVAKLHDGRYIRGVMLDVTYGRGGFWNLDTGLVPVGAARLMIHDLYTVDGVDFRKLPEATASVDTVVFDPPYKLNGTPALGDMDNRYGVDKTSNRWQDTHQLICEGISEASRVLKPKGHLLLKCMNQVCSGRVRWQTDEFTAHAATVGFRKVEQLEFLREGRPQPTGVRQVHARRNLSSLLIFEKTAR